MSDLRYRDWILDTIDSLRSRKARPDLERICRMVRRRHGSDPERTRAELERLIQERAVLRVSYKGSTSYRNAARVQRRGRRATSTDSTGPGLCERERSNSGDSGNGNDEQSESTERAGQDLGKSLHERCRSTGTGTRTTRHHHVPRHEITSTREQQTELEEPRSAEGAAGGSTASGACAGEGDSAAKHGGGSGRGGEGAGDGACSTSASGVKHGGGGSAGAGGGSDGAGGGACSSSASGVKHGGGGSTVAGGGGDACRMSREGAGGAAGFKGAWGVKHGGGGGHAPPGPREVLGCLSSHEQHETLTRQRARALENSRSSRRKRRRMMMMVEMKKKSRTAETAARALGQAGSRLCKTMMKRRKRKGGGGGGARDDLSKEDEKDEETMETESGEEVDEEEEQGKIEEESKGLPPVHPQTTKTEGPSGVLDENPSSFSVSLETRPMPSDVPLREEKFQPLLFVASSSLSSSPSPSSPSRPDADSEGQGVTIGTGDLKEEERSATPNQLQSNTQSLSVMVMESVRTPSSIPIKSYSGCKTEVGMSSCLLTPSASPGAAEERGMNGGMFVKAESPVVNPVDWTVSDVASYFTAVGFPEQALAFRTQEIDGKSLLLMQRNDVLTGLSIRLGPALKIYERHVKVLQRTHFQDDEAFC